MLPGVQPEVCTGAPYCATTRPPSLHSTVMMKCHSRHCLVQRFRQPIGSKDGLHFLIRTTLLYTFRRKCFTLTTIQEVQKRNATLPINRTSSMSALHTSRLLAGLPLGVGAVRAGPNAIPMQLLHSTFGTHASLRTLHDVNPT